MNISTCSEMNRQALKPLLFLPGASFYPKRRAVTCFSPRLIPSLVFSVPGEHLQHSPFQQLPPNNKNIVFFYFIFPPLRLGGAITPHAAFCKGPGGDEKQITLAVDDNVFPQAWILWAVLLWRRRRRSSLLSLSFICYYYITQKAWFTKNYVHAVVPRPRPTRLLMYPPR